MNHQPIKRPLLDGVRPRRPQTLDATYRRPNAPMPSRSPSAPPRVHPQVTQAILQPVAVSSDAQAQPITMPPKRFTYTQPSTKKNTIWQRFQLPLLIVSSMIAGVFAQSLVFGCALLSVYGLVALIVRIPSRTTFTLATLSLGTVSMMLLIKPNHELISNFASYTFILLIIGVVGLGLESRMPKRMNRIKRR